MHGKKRNEDSEDLEAGARTARSTTPMRTAGRRTTSHLGLVSAVDNRRCSADVMHHMRGVRRNNDGFADTQTDSVIGDREMRFAFAKCRGARYAVLMLKPLSRL